jgi:hypothetical protein
MRVRVDIAFKVFMYAIDQFWQEQLLIVRMVGRG